MNGKNFFHGFCLNDEASIDVKIEPQGFIEDQILVGDWYDKFSDKGDAAKRELMGEALLVDAFKEPGALVPMYLDGRADYLWRPEIGAAEVCMLGFLPALSALPVQ